MYCGSIGRTVQGWGWHSPSTELGEGACSRQLGPPTLFQATSLPKSLLQTRIWVFSPSISPPKEGRRHRLRGGSTPVPAELSQSAQINCVSAQ